MRQDQIEIVQNTWASVVPIATQAAGLFYDRLFQLDPEIRHLFRSVDLAQQKVRLVAALSVAVAGLEETDGLKQMLFDLGRRHSDYGVQPRHYQAVGEALIWTLEQGLGAAWTDAAREAWIAIYEVIAAEMLRGAGATPEGAAQNVA